MQTNTEVFMVMGRAGKYDLVDYLLSKRRLPEHQVIHPQRRAGGLANAE